MDITRIWHMFAIVGHYMGTDMKGVIIQDKIEIDEVCGSVMIYLGLLWSNIQWEGWEVSHACIIGLIYFSGFPLPH